MQPLTRISECTAEIVGFDTEYTSDGAHLLSVQLAWNDQAVFLPLEKLSVATLAKHLRAMGIPSGSEVILVSYFSLAELQFLPVKKEAFSWREYGAGSLDCSFYSPLYKLTLHVFDLARFFDKQSLAKVAESFGLQKLKWKRDSVTRKDLRQPGFREYAINDAILCLEIVRLLRIQFSPWQVDPIQEKTAASTAASVFRRGWVAEEFTSGNNRARLAGMRACWGGRAEALSRGSFPRVKEYDLKSAYPRAAVSLGEMPIQGSWVEYSTISKLLKCRGGFAKVAFAFPPETRYPCLPVVLPECQLYCLTGCEWVTLDEIRLALEMGAKLHIFEGWGYKKGTTALRDYMEEMLAKRAVAQGAQKVAYKLLANALIGKFAQRVSDIDIDGLRTLANKQGVSVDDVGKMTREELGALGLTARVRVGSVFMPEWNALITGRVRAILGKACQEVDGVYLATDAVWTESDKKPSHPDFELKREGAAIVARTRLGLIDGQGDDLHIAHHSIWNRKAAENSLRNMDSSRSRYRVRKPVKLRESMRKNVAVGIWEESFRMADTTWDHKRELLENSTSKPWRNTREYVTAVGIARNQKKAAQKIESLGTGSAR